jgi:hypothetical protein
MKELLERLDVCHAESQTADGPTARYLAGAMIRNLGEFRRLCVSLRHEILRDGPTSAAA